MLFDWFYQNHSTPDTSDNELIELLLTKEMHGLQKSQIRQIFELWSADHRATPHFMSAEQELKKHLRIR
ncbi:hypothetical protein COT72_04845 [archaeon CG10_big_fil_rev_8_21_14_0_10_43_11]|nr:MAG: hypothetical protein COT72_04845 [archaeon CG10_big_fil_rev_8_21_14_0_10_43_11]